MGRLIDADLLKKNIAKWLQGSDPQETVMVKLDDIAVSVIMEIDEQPTAYDVDNVVAELKEAFPINPYPNEFTNGRDFAIKKAIEVVRKGGK